MTILRGMGLFEQETEQARLRHQRAVDIAKINANTARLAAEAAAAPARIEAEAALVRARGDHFDTELTLIAEQNKPALAQAEATREMYRGLVKLGALATARDEGRAVAMRRIVWRGPVVRLWGHAWDRCPRIYEALRTARYATTWRLAFLLSQTGGAR